MVAFRAVWRGSGASAPVPPSDRHRLIFAAPGLGYGAKTGRSMIFQLLVAVCIATLVGVSVLHSWGGERYLWRPLFKHKGNPVLESPLARMVLRGAWHLTSVMWLVLALVLHAAAFAPDTLVATVLGAVGISFVVVGVIDLIGTRGRHIGWPLLMLVGVFALGALAVRAP